MARSPSIKVTVTTEEAARIKSEAKEKGMSVSAHARNRLISKPNPNTTAQS